MKHFLLISVLLLLEITAGSEMRTLVTNHDGYLNNDQECKTNFECPSSCCDNFKCSDIGKCKDRITYIYISVGVLSALFLLAIVIFFIVSIQQTRKNVAKIRDENQKKAEEFKNQAETNRKKAEEAQKGLSDKRY